MIIKFFDKLTKELRMAEKSIQPGAELIPYYGQYSKTVIELAREAIKDIAVSIANGDSLSKSVQAYRMILVKNQVILFDRLANNAENYDAHSSRDNMAGISAHEDIDSIIIGVMESIGYTFDGSVEGEDNPFSFDTDIVPF